MEQWNSDPSPIQCILRQHEALQRPDAQNQNAQGDAVPAKDCEGVLLDVIHQEADCHDGHDKRHDAAHDPVKTRPTNCIKNN